MRCDRCRATYEYYETHFTRFPSASLTFPDGSFRVSSLCKDCYGTFQRALQGLGNVPVTPRQKRKTESAEREDDDFEDGDF